MKNKIASLSKKAESIKASIKRFRALRSKVLPYAKAAGYLVDADVFKPLAKSKS